MGRVLRVATPAIVIEADEGIVFSKLNQLCDRIVPALKNCPPVPIRRYAARMAPELAPKRFARLAKGLPDDLRQSEALEVLQDYLPETGRVVFDAGNCAAAALHYLRIPRAVSTTIALGMGGMGYAIPAAVGAQMGSAPDSRTMVFCGDGAFLMLGTEVNTAVHYQLPILFVVFNNGMHGMCVTRQQLYFKGRIEGSQYPAVSIADMARGLGASDQLWVGSAGTIDQLSSSLREYLEQADRPGVIELRIPCEEIPPFTPFMSSDAPTYEVAPLPRLRISEVHACCTTPPKIPVFARGRMDWEFKQ